MVGAGDIEEMQLLPEMLPEEEMCKITPALSISSHPKISSECLLVTECGQKSTGKEAWEKCAAPIVMLRRARARQSMELKANE